MVDTLLAIIYKDKSAQVYVNELRLLGQIRVKRKVKIGDPISADHILDMGRIQIKGVKIPDECGVVFVFSVGWRKGFFYDLVPLHGDPPPRRDFDIEDLLGSLFSYLTFQERFKINENTWELIFKQKWFPFCHLNNELIKEMISHAKAGWNIDDLLPKLADNAKKLIQENDIAKLKIKYIEEHSSILEAGFKRYLDSDYISCISILYPRIEGLLRSFYQLAGYTEGPTSKRLSEAVVKHHENLRINYSLLLPSKFHHYLDNIYGS